jgi:predicted membrane protein
MIMEGAAKFAFYVIELICLVMLVSIVLILPREYSLCFLAPLIVIILGALVLSKIKQEYILIGLILIFIYILSPQLIIIGIIIILLYYIIKWIKGRKKKEPQFVYGSNKQKRWRRW